MSVRVKPALPLGATLPHGPCSWFSCVPRWEEGFWGYCDLLLELLRFLPQLLHLPHGGRLKGWLFSLLPGTRGVCRGTPTFLFLTSHTMGGWSPSPHQARTGWSALPPLPAPPHLESQDTPAPPTAPSPRGQSQASPSYLGSDFRLPALVPRRLLAPSAATPARHLPRLCCQRSWPGLAPPGGVRGGADSEG